MDAAPAGRAPTVAAVEGIDARPVSDWLAANIAGRQPPFSFELIAGGRSNLTYRVTDAAGRAFALRRPPVSHVLPTAHDMAREHTVISALGPTGVPVPRTLGLCTDRRSTGPLLRHVLRRGPHRARRTRPRPSSTRPPGRMPATRSSTPSPGSTRSTWTRSGSATSPAATGYIARQLKRWHGQFGQSTVDGAPGPAVVDRVHELLAAQIPEQQGGGHRPRGLPTRQHRARRRGQGARPSSTGRSAPSATRWPTSASCSSTGPSPATATRRCSAWPRPRSRVRQPRRAARALRRASGRDVSAIPYYRAFGFWKLACILQGVYVRYAGGAAAGDRSGVDQFADHVGRLGERALAEVESL